MEGDVEGESEKLTGALDELLDGWDSFAGGVRVSERATGARKGRDRSTAQMAIVIALITHVHETARLLRPFMPDGITVVHMPLVRAIFECTLTAVWCDEVDDGAEAIMKEHGRQRRALQGALEALPSFKNDGKPLPNQEWAEYQTPSGQQGRHFERLADEVALEGAYAHYRAMSGLSHPSITLADQYVTEIPSQEESPDFEFNARPKPLGSVSWSSLVAYCLVWSGTVANYYDEDRTRRSELRRIAKLLGIKAELPVRLRTPKRREAATTRRAR